MTRDDLEAEARSCQERIDRAYWSFSRTMRGKPPILVVPDAYQRLREIKALLPLVSPCGAVHIASKVNQRFHLVRVSCGCEAWVRLVPGSPTRLGRVTFCERVHCADAGVGGRVFRAAEWLACTLGPRQPSLFQEAG